MNHELIRIDLEKQFGNELNQLIQGDIIKEILQKAKIEDTENVYKKIFDGHHFKISNELSPKLHQLCREVLGILEFNEEIDFYITNQPDINAVSIPRLEDNQKHIIAFNSGLIEKLDFEELRFVIGHEIGHLITHNSEIWRIINFVFPDSNRIPLIISNKIHFWNRLSELSADRFGYIASANLEIAVSNFFKLSSGISTDKIEFNFEEYLIQNEKMLEGFKNASGMSAASHPINPLRLQAIKHFSESELYKSIQNRNIIEDKVLAEQIHDLLGNFALLADSELDQHRMYFVASAGFMIANADEKFDIKEYDKIINTLSNYTLFPQNILKDVIDSDEIISVFEKSTNAILEKNPSERFPMFDFMIQLVLSDNEIMGQEINILFKIGVSIFKFNEKEIAQLIAEAIHKNFIPKLF